MSDAELFRRLALVFACSGGALVWGLTTAAFAPRRWGTQVAVALAGAVVACGGVALFVPDALPVAAGVSAALGVLAVGAVRAMIAAAATRLARPRVAGLLVSVAAAGGLVAEGWRYDRRSEELADQAFEMTDKDTPPATAVASVRVYTDRGTVVPVRVPVDPRTPTEATDDERGVEVLAKYSERWIRRGPPTDHSNCHGWVFTGGQFNLSGEQVDVILSENGYEKVDKPQAGDVVVYRADTLLRHTGVVQAVLPDGIVLVESKWGWMGVFLHAAGDSPYGQEYEFRRSPRAGHLLAGLPPVTGGGITRAAP